MDVFDPLEENALEILAAVAGCSVEELAAVLPSPVHNLSGGLRLSCGEPALVVLEIQSDRFVVAEAAITWRSAHTPTVELGDHHLDVPVLRELDQLRRAVDSAVRRRLATFVTCQHCNWHGPREHMWSRDPGICHGCASKDHGVVF